MIGYGPELQDMAFGTEDYTCTEVYGNSQGVRLTLVPNDLNKPAAMDFVHASWQDVMEAAVTLHVNSHAIYVSGDWWPGVEDELSCDLEDVYEVTRPHVRLIKITYKTKGPVMCTIDHLTTEYVWTLDQDMQHVLDARALGDNTTEYHPASAGQH